MLLVAVLMIVGWRLAAVMIEDRASGFAFESPAQAPVDGDAPVEDGVELEGSGDAVDSGSTSTVWVHVAGAVCVPGLRELPTGARVGDAIDAAGGASSSAALDAVNLARLLGDGEQVYVPTTEEVANGGGRAPGPPAGGLAGSVGTSDHRVDINTAGEAELVTLPGVGASTAAKIIADRETNGPFAAPEDIMRVSGIGEKKYEAMRELIVVR